MEAVTHTRQLALAGAIAVLAALGASSPAFGGDCLPSGGPSSVQQYVEQIPQACGSHATGTGTKQRTLPPKIKHKIQKQGGTDKKLLKNIATSEQYGAPQQQIKTPPAVHKAPTAHKAPARKAQKTHKVQKAHKAHKARKRHKVHQATKPVQRKTRPKSLSSAALRRGNPLSASVGVVTEGSDWRLLALLIVMAATTVAVLVSALRRRRAGR